MFTEKGNYMSEEQKLEQNTQFNQPEQNTQFGQQNQNSQATGQYSYGAQVNAPMQYNQPNGQYGYITGNPQYGYNTWQQQPTKGEGTGLGIASMILGIISVLLFCTCVNWITGIVAIILGIVQLVKNKDKTFAVVGIVTAAVSLLLSIWLWGSALASASDDDLNYNDLYNDYYEDFYDDYYEDGEVDYYDGYTNSQGGPDFLSKYL